MPTIESFVIQLPNNHYYIDSTQSHTVTTTNIEHAVHFQSIHTAIQFNRIIEGHIVSTFAGVQGV